MTDEIREVEVENIDPEEEAERVRLTAEMVKAENAAAREEAPIEEE